MKRIFSVLNLFIFMVLSININAQQQINQTIIGEQQNDFFGYALAINATGNIIIASTPVSGADGFRKGEAKVYENINNSWELIFEIRGDEIFQELGAGVSMSDNGDIIAIGSTKVPPQGNYGEIKIFEKNGSTYIQKGNTITSSQNFDFFGEKLVISDDGNTLISAAYRDSTNAIGAGRVEVFQFNSGNNTWEQLGGTIYGINEFEFAGYGIAYNDDGLNKRIVVGSPLAEDETGLTRVFQLNGNDWEQLGQTILGYVQYSKSGNAVAMSGSGNRIAIGEPVSTNSATVRIFDFNSDSNQWEQFGNTLEGFEQGDRFGSVLSLSDEGLLLGVGAYKANQQFGRVYLYRFNATSQLWELSGIPIDGQSNEFGEFGRAIEMSDDGSTFITSEPRYNDDTGYDFGAVMVYNTDPILGIEASNLNASKILLYPNPITSTVFFKFNSVNPQTIKIYTVQGQLVKTIKYAEMEDNRLDFTAYSSGVYIVKVETRDGTWKQRVVKK